MCQPATHLTQRVRSHLANVLITHYVRVSLSLCTVNFLCERIHSYNIIRWTCVVQIERRARKSPSKHASNFFHFFIRALFLFLSFDGAVSLQPSFRLPFFSFYKYIFLHIWLGKHDLHANYANFLLHSLSALLLFLFYSALFFHFFPRSIFFCHSIPSLFFLFSPSFLSGLFVTNNVLHKVELNQRSL